MTSTDIFIRLLLAVIVGGAIGYEREYKNRPAGFRTHILVCVGATVVSLIQMEMIHDVMGLIATNPALAEAMKIDMGRLGAAVISGIGFLGAGTILQTKGSVKGLTTAASLWMVACVGLAIGMGYYLIGLVTGLIIVIVLVFLGKIQEKLFHSIGVMKLEVGYKNRVKAIGFLEDYFEKFNIHVLNLEFALEKEDDQRLCVYSLNLPKSIKPEKVLRDISMNDLVISARIVRGPE
jgi:putative Mg2+ transporter-C (MgtC) family protein